MILRKSLVSKFKKSLFGPTEFLSSTDYWIKRYESGGNSGSGSYGVLAQYKAEIINQFVIRNKLSTVIEFGCGDGNNLSLFQFQYYLGLDVSTLVVRKNRKRFQDHPGWAFMSVESLDGWSFKGDLCLSLDVIFHLVEDKTFESYMKSLFQSSCHYVIIYSSNEDFDHPDSHVRHRKFSKWIEVHAPEFRLREMIQNPHKANLTADNSEKSFADFYIYERNLNS